MNFHFTRLVAFSFAVLIIGMPLLVASAASPTNGYVTYRVTLNNNQGSPSNSFLVNYTSTPSNQNGFVTLTLAAVSNMQNLTYSRLVNTTSLPEIFPYVPGVTNQTFSYSTHGMTISAKISNVGTSPITFSSANYNAEKYLLDFTVTNSSSGKSISANGVLMAAPSGLLYSVLVQESGSSSSSVSVQLIATNLPLNDPSNAISTTEGSALVGAGIVGVAAVAVPWKLRRKKNTPSASGSEKPSYWVD